MTRKRGSVFGRGEIECVVEERFHVSELRVLRDSVAEFKLASLIELSHASGHG